MKLPFLPNKLILLIWMSLLSAGLIGQQTQQIELIRADLLVPAEKDGKKARKLIGDVQFKHQDALMYCDSAYLYQEINTMEAYGSVRINQGDTINLYGDYLLYDGDTREAIVEGDTVVLISNEFELTTDRLLYNRKTNVASYFTGGFIESKSDSNTLESMRGYYVSTAKMFDFKDSVVVNNPNFVMQSDTLKYFTVTEEVEFLGPTTIVGDSNLIYCEIGWYKTVEDQSKYFDNAYMISGNRKLTGDTLFYDRKLGFGKATGNIQIEDTLEKIIIQGDYGELFEQNDSAVVSREPLMIKKLDADTIFLHADTFKVYQSDSQKFVLAYHDVRIFKTDLQAVCDSVSYLLNDSIIQLIGEPILWSSENEMSADSVDLILKNKQLHSMEMRQNAFIVSQIDSIRYNQIKGSDMTGYFKDKQIHKIYVTGNGQTIYFGQDDDGKFIGVNWAESAEISITMKEQEINSITFIQEAEASMYPMGELDPKTELRFKGFQWRIERRPLSKEDLFSK